MRDGLKAQLSGNSDEWSTPKYLLSQIQQEFGKIDFDPCPLMGDDKMALFKDWKGNVFINPPYSNVEEFLNKGLMELKKGNATQLIFLIIPRTSTKYWNKYVMKFADCIYFIPHRLKFGDTKSCAPFPSCIIIFKDLIKKEHIRCKTWKYKRNETVGNFFPQKEESLIRAKREISVISPNSIPSESNSRLKAKALDEPLQVV